MNNPIAMAFIDYLDIILGMSPVSLSIKVTQLELRCVVCGVCVCVCVVCVCVWCVWGLIHRQEVTH